MQRRYNGVSRRELMRRARAMLEAIQMTDHELSILLTGDDQIQMLNKLYRKKDRPTDVLAFGQHDGKVRSPASRLLGDVAISVPTALRQATERGAPVMSELTALLAHGLLHLVGWDHDTPTKDRRMRAETSRLCGAAAAPERRGRRARRASRKTRARANRGPAPHL